MEALFFKSSDLFLESVYERVKQGYEEEFEVTWLEPLGFENGDVDVILAFTTDSRIQLFHLVTTEDDLGFFSKYDAAPVVRVDTLEKFPELGEVINRLTG